MPDLLNMRFIKALLREPIDRTPIWLMRQAGRYLPEYRKLRAKTPDFFTFCQTPELACEATLQPIARFPLDAAIIFSDILTVPLAMGCDITLLENQGPIILNPIQSEKAIDRLKTNVIEKMEYVFSAIKLTQKELNQQLPLIGFAGSPWTVATYMVEGKSSKTFEIIKKMLFSAPHLLHRLLEKLTTVTIDYVNRQVAAGADVIMLFDSWGGVLSPQDYKIFSLNYMQKIISGLNKKIPTIIFSKGCCASLEAIAHSGCDAMGLDWSIDLEHAKERVGHKVALQGNLDPCVLLSTPEIVRKKAKELLAVYQNQTGYIFNLGHGISKDTPVENVVALMETIAG
ncbi:MAG: uroporphyrinogen decarboxylase [Gammaproteobacteria bacterium RIFCSPHIGHO2_12_FULL_38_14]|nr:MAG: uroporphyrinogen decarboxylase [Gammaproteobacteria bacterium RIFCSPHIGHO2_12_FULL_38_14]